MATKDRDRIIALQKQLKIARAALERMEFRHGSDIARAALEEMNQIEWASRPSPAIA